MVGRGEGGSDRIGERREENDRERGRGRERGEREREAIRQALGMVTHVYSLHSLEVEIGNQEFKASLV